MVSRRFPILWVCLALLLGAVACKQGQVAQPAVTTGETLTGLDVLEKEGFKALDGKRIGVITNQTGRTRDGRRTVDVLAGAPNVTLAAIFAPEHGIEGKLSGKVKDGSDASSGLRVYSLYGKTRRPTAAMLEGLDALVFDIQGAGARYYTYSTTMAYAMEGAARHNVEFFVLDRPNPITGAAVEGPMLDRDRTNFEGYFPLPLRHGMTLGELARLFNQENEIGAQLTVIKMEGWRRALWFDQTGLEWVNPSPNLRSVLGSTLYPAVELLRAGDVSVGRGTETPFELFGAPWMDGEELAEYLNGRTVPGVRFEPVRYRPAADVHKGKECEGVRLVLVDREALDAGLLGMELLSALRKLYPKNFQLRKTIRLVGSKETLARLTAGDDPREIVEGWKDELEAFRKLRAEYLLY